MSEVFYAFTGLSGTASAAYYANSSPPDPRIPPSAPAPLSYHGCTQPRMVLTAPATVPSGTDIRFAGTVANLSAGHLSFVLPGGVNSNTTNPIDADGDFDFTLTTTADGNVITALGSTNAVFDITSLTIESVDPA